MQYRQISETEISFTGSIAYIFKKQLERQLQKYGLKPGVFKQAPMNGLKEYHKIDMIL